MGVNAKNGAGRTTPGPGPLFATRNSLSPQARAQAAGTLNARLADAIDLQAQCKQAHWNVKGPQFIALHELFDDVYAGVTDDVDLIAERVVQLGGVAEGTIGIVAGRTELAEYPVATCDGMDHVARLSGALAQFGAGMGRAVQSMTELQDPGSADLCTQVLRDIDKWLWFVEAHGQGLRDSRVAATVARRA